jgi:hypothetical protein
MCEGGIGGEVCLDGLVLDGRRRLCEEVDDAGYLFDYWMRLDAIGEGMQIATYLDSPLQTKICSVQSGRNDQLNDNGKRMELSRSRRFTI